MLYIIYHYIGHLLNDVGKILHSVIFSRERSEPLSIIHLTFAEPRSGSAL